MARVSQMRLAVIALLVVSAIWGAHAVIGANVERVIAPLPLTVGRFTVTALCFLPSTYHARKRFRQMSMRTWLTLAAAGLSVAVFYPLFYYQSLLTLSPVESLLIINAAPILAAFLAFVFYRERLTRKQLLGMGIALCGVILIATQASGRGHASLAALLDAVIGMASFAFYTVISRKLFQALPRFDVLGITSVFGAIVLWFIAFVQGKVSVVVQSYAHFSLASWLGFFFIALFVSVIAYTLFGYALPRVPTGLSASLTFYPQALFAALLQWLIIGQLPSQRTFLGGGILLIGTFLLQNAKRKAGAESPLEETLSKDRSSST
ncbi:DMT family transporter [Ferroacidibacillus organovorans]|uniref:EamA domain-containing protein n=1 Tax=Ferroacidibacillus organovorans TaxID=1765683 RepID=A0A853K6M9_9BACL|nr:DMT family transporter [Ferroacidibacillus organovorans]KYP79249.1 hypothetical protein AYJ22_15205 [Ferroacidibacillus organovorans]OAG86698.1 hypothetical protein AYW79_14980 [Ferroacidibacillus organovorans]